MAVNDGHMLPKKIRIIPQMEDLLQTEQNLIDEINHIIRAMLQEAVLTENEVVTLEYLKNLADSLSGLICDATEYPEQLMVRLQFHIENLVSGSHTKWEDQLKNYIPAHLKVLFEYMARLQSEVSLYMFTTRFDCVEISFPPEYTDGRTSQRADLKASIPMLEYVSISFQ